MCSRIYGAILVAAILGVGDAGVATCDGDVLASTSDACTATPTVLVKQMFRTISHPMADSSAVMGCARETYYVPIGTHDHQERAHWDRKDGLYGSRAGNFRFYMSKCHDDSFIQSARDNYPE